MWLFTDPSMSTRGIGSTERVGSSLRNTKPVSAKQSEEPESTRPRKGSEKRSEERDIVNERESERPDALRRRGGTRGDSTQLANRVLGELDTIFLAGTGQPQARLWRR